MTREISEVLSRLDNESRYVLSELFGLDTRGDKQSVNDVAGQLHCSRSHVKDVRDAALRALREPATLAAEVLH